MKISWILSSLVLITIMLIIISPVSATLFTSGAYTDYGRWKHTTATYHGDTWAAMRSTAETEDKSTGTMGAYISAGDVSGKWWYDYRGWVTYDTSAIPDTDIATDAYWHIYQVGTVDTTLHASAMIGIVNLPYTDVTGFDQFIQSEDDVIWYTISSFSGSNVWLDIQIPTDFINLDGQTTLGVVISDSWDNTSSSLTWSSLGLIKMALDADSSYLTVTYETPTPTPTPDPSNATLSINLLEKYSNAALVGQSVTLTPTVYGAGETKTSSYGETLHFNVVNGLTYWINASRSGYEDYNETYTITSSSGVYTVYMERIFTPIANHSYAHFSVVDQTNGGLIPNAEVRLSDGQTKLTNSAGYTWFSVNNSEQINYYVSKPSGYWPAYGAFNITSDESILVALQRYSGPTATATMPGWTPVTLPTTGTGVDPVVTLSAQLRQQNVQEGMDVWYTNLPFISQFLFLLFIIGGLGLMAGGTRRN
jgi:hypothetical protein